MTSAFVQLPLVRMVDLAISPTEGQVNFHLLQAILHALIQKSHAQTVAVEIHGTEATKLQEQLKAAPEKPSYTIKETIDKSAQGKDQEIYVLQPDAVYQGSSSVAKEKVDCLEAEVNDIKQQLSELRDLPGNLGIIDAVKNFDEKSSTVIDVFHMMALLKRIEAAEEGMVKIASIVEDLIKSPTGGLQLDAKNVVCQQEEEPTEPDASVSEKKSATSVKKVASKTSSEKGTAVHPSTGTGTGSGPSSAPPSIPPGASKDLENWLRELAGDVKDIQKRLNIKKKSLDTISGGLAEEEEHADGHMNEMESALFEERIKEVADHVDRLDLSANEAITRLHNQFTDIEKDFNELLNRIELGTNGNADPNEPNACCSSVYQKLLQLEADIADMNETSGRLLTDKDEKTKLLEFLVEQIEVVKSVKADREEIEEALADKADACAVQRKVSHDQFDNACEELSKGIGEALGKLVQQELLWQQALEDIQNEIGNKLDKMDLGPLRDFINNKLRMLQDKMRSLAALKREQEAAGTKNKLLRDVQCISCDKEVVMQKEFDISMRPMAPSVPPHRSMAPYLAYELDALRKQQKAVPGGKNLHSLETAMAGRVQKKTDDHICNRYCGGSHTITTPHQRVTRLGHFLMQWGPEAQPMSPTEKKPSIIPRISSAEKPAELNGQPAKLASKMDQAKRTSRASQPKVSKALDTEPKKLSFESKKKLLASGAETSKKISVISEDGLIKVKDPNRPSKQKQVTIPDVPETVVEAPEPEEAKETVKAEEVSEEPKPVTDATDAPSLATHEIADDLAEGQEAAAATAADEAEA